MALGGENTAIPACETTLTPSSTTSATLATTSGLNQRIKKLSISSLESLNNESDIVTESINQTTTTASKQQPESSTKPVSSQQQTEDEYDYIKAGAKPKTTRNKQQKQTTSSASTSCSSLSSLISQTSSAMTSSNKPSSSISSLSSSSQQRRGNVNVMTSKTNQSRLMAPPDFPISDDIELTHQQQQNETRCPLCMKSIGDYDLEAHFQIEHREYECPFCGFIFDSEFTMQQHLSSAHSEATDNVSGRVSSREADVFDDELLPMSAERLFELK